MRIAKIAIIGSGFAGSILARILALQGHQVFLVDRARHPRFALGESSTPLAAICLERLAARYGLDDLHALAAWGRWMERLPHLRRGLKRGFTFYGHEPGRPFDGEQRMLVAASPSDAIADTHWLRADVDHHLVRKAAGAGAEVLDETDLTSLESLPTGWRLHGTRRGRSVDFDADLLLDASGPGGFLAKHLAIPALDVSAPHTSLVFGHFEGMALFPPTSPKGPYPDEQAAIHHLLEEGWMYVLPFDDGLVSAGFVLSEEVPESPDAAWNRILSRYPTLQDQFGSARPIRPLGKIPRLQHHLSQAAGEGWALLPHAYCFLSPLFSTGIAWSLLAVERLALTLESGEGFDRYGRLLEQESAHLRKLVAGAYESMRDFASFGAYSFLYFAAASYAEASQRLLPPPGGVPWAWQGFLGSTDPVTVGMLYRILTALKETPGSFEDEVRKAIGPRNLAGLADPARKGQYPVDLDALVEASDLLGLTRDEIREEIPRLRG